MSTKKFKLSADSIKTVVTGFGGCIATDKIVVEGLPVGYMYREEPDFPNDSGWRFLSGTEDQNYMDNPDNSGIYSVNTIVNYDQSILPYLSMPRGTELKRSEDTDQFINLNGQ